MNSKIYIKYAGGVTELSDSECMKEGALQILEFAIVTFYQKGDQYFVGRYLKTCPCFEEGVGEPKYYDHEHQCSNSFESMLELYKFWSRSLLQVDVITDPNVDFEQHIENALLHDPYPIEELERERREEASMLKDSEVVEPFQSEDLMEQEAMQYHIEPEGYDS